MKICTFVMCRIILNFAFVCGLALVRGRNCHAYGNCTGKYFMKHV